MLFPVILSYYFPCHSEASAEESISFYKKETTLGALPDPSRSFRMTKKDVQKNNVILYYSFYPQFWFPIASNMTGH